MFVSNSSLLNRNSISPLQSIQARNFSIIQAASPVGESFNPGVRLEGFVDWMEA